VAAPEVKITVDGNPNILLDISTFFNDTQYAMNGTYSGGMSYTTSDDRSGACGIDLGFNAVADLEA
jgi:hypothetical protein